MIRIMGWHIPMLVFTTVYCTIAQVQGIMPWYEVLGPCLGGYFIGWGAMSILSDALS